MICTLKHLASLDNHSCGYDSVYSYRQTNVDRIITIVLTMHVDSAKEVTMMEPAQGDQWPKEREGHAACCLNYGEGHPVLLVTGGLGKGSKVLADMWLLDVDSGKWTEVRIIICWFTL